MKKQAIPFFDGETFPDGRSVRINLNNVTYMKELPSAKYVGTRPDGSACEKTAKLTEFGFVDGSTLEMWDVVVGQVDGRDITWVGDDEC